MNIDDIIYINGYALRVVSLYVPKHYREKYTFTCVYPYRQGQAAQRRYDFPANTPYTTHLEQAQMRAMSNAPNHPLTAPKSRITTTYTERPYRHDDTRPDRPAGYILDRWLDKATVAIKPVGLSFKHDPAVPTLLGRWLQMCAKHARR